MLLAVSCLLKLKSEESCKTSLSKVMQDINFVKVFFNDVSKEGGGIALYSLHHWSCRCLQFKIYPIIASYMEQDITRFAFKFGIWPCSFCITPGSHRDKGCNKHSALRSVEMHHTWSAICKMQRSAREWHLGSYNVFTNKGFLRKSLNKGAPGMLSILCSVLKLRVIFRSSICE